MEISNINRCTRQVNDIQMASFELIYTLIFGIIVINSPVVEGQCKFLPNSSNVCMCHCHNNCHEGCLTCDLGWGGSKSYHCQKENIVYKKHTMQDNTYSRQFDSSKAVDGDPHTYSKVQEKEDTVWWRVQLDSYHSINRINVTMDLVSNVEYNVYVTHDSLVTNNHSLCDTERDRSNQRAKSVVFRCSQAILGSIIEVQAPPHSSLTIYEVSSESCANGVYGEECDHLCPTKCHRSCNKKTGECDQCPLGQTGPSCNLTCSRFCGPSGCNRTTGQCHQCAASLWGDDCTRICPNGCNYECQRETGHCKVCHPGYRFNGTTCKLCQSGFYGEACSQSCDIKCKNGVCDAETGKCTDCIEGLYGPFCQYNCSNNCLNFSCSANSGECFDCAPGRYGAQCDRCQKGYYGEQCKQECDYCNSNDCDPVNGTCEKCEDGKFGAFCKHYCSSSCKDKTCNIQGKCMSCRKGFYGEYCESLCPPINCEICNKTSSECLRCKTGWYGSTCKKVCPIECKAGCYMINGSCDDVPMESIQNSSQKMVNVIILGGTALLIVLSIGFLAKICQLQNERNKARQQANYRRPFSLIGQNSSHQYHSLVEEHPYQNVNVEEAVGEGETGPVTDNACATIEDCNAFFKAEINSDLRPPKRFMRFASLDEEMLRRKHNRVSELSTPYEAVVIRDDSSRVSYYKK